jgi:hypothetical protein
MNTRYKVLCQGAAVLALMVFLESPAAADSETYSFFGSGFLEGTSFTYISPGGFLTFPSGPLVPTTATDLFFHDVSGADFPIDTGQIIDFDFVSEDELLLHSNGFATTYDFTIRNGFSFTHLTGPAYSLDSGSSILAFGYLLDVETNFDVVGVGELGIRKSQDSGGGGSTTTVPEPGSLVLFATGSLALPFLLRRHLFADRS